jgi:hypothetical protein
MCMPFFSQEIGEPVPVKPTSLNDACLALLLNSVRVRMRMPIISIITLSLFDAAAEKKKTVLTCLTH